MANFLHIARPYALAAFNYAHHRQQLPTWKFFLETAAFIANQPMVLKLIHHPDLSSANLLQLFEDVLGSQVDIISNSGLKNFLALIAQKKRFIALPAIAEIFNAHYASMEKIATVHMVTAIELNDATRQKFAQALSQRIQREVKLHCDVDSSIIGGAVIRIGDRVIDGSMRGKLTRLLKSLLR